MLTPSLTPFSGVQFIFSYATTFFAAIGIDASFTISMVVAVVEVVGVLEAELLRDRSREGGVGLPQGHEAGVGVVEGGPGVVAGVHVPGTEHGDREWGHGGFLRKDASSSRSRTT